MTKEEYKDRICNCCINSNCKENICEEKLDMYNVYKCTGYISNLNYKCEANTKK